MISSCPTHLPGEKRRFFRNLLFLLRRVVLTNLKHGTNCVVEFLADLPRCEGRHDDPGEGLLALLAGSFASVSDRLDYAYLALSHRDTFFYYFGENAVSNKGCER